MAFCSSRTLPGQRIALQRGLGIGGQLKTLVQEAARQRQDILAALGEWRHLQLDDAQAVEQVLAEGAGADGLAQRRVGGGDDTHAGAPRAVGTEALELPGLQHPQQLRLAAAAERAELIEEQRAAVGGLEAPGARARAGESARLGAEQLRLDELIGECCRGLP